MLEKIFRASKKPERPEERGLSPREQELKEQVATASKENMTEIYMERLRDPATQEQIMKLYQASNRVRLGLTTPEALMEKFNERIDDAMRITHIKRKWKVSSSLYFPLFQRAYIGIRRNKKKPESLLEMSATEAHEKGHRVRYGSIWDSKKANAKEARQGFNKWSRVRESAGNVGVTTGLLSNPALYELILTGGFPFSSAIIWLQWVARGPYMLQPHEVVERMAQLKNYFGMRKGSDVFTKEHLDYARKHYITDVMDNKMKRFFKMITPETEDTFLKIMNSIGV